MTEPSQVETVRGPVATSDLGVVFMHEHVFILSQEIMANYPEGWGDGEAREADAVGPMRMVATSLDDLGNLLPPDLSDRPRFGADERPATPHILLVIDGGHLPPGNHIVPPDGLHGVTLLDLLHRIQAGLQA